MKSMAIAEMAPTNNGEDAIQKRVPYVVRVKLQGSADMLLHGWDVDAVQAKAEAKRGSAEKKTDNIESYVVRNDKGEICIPTTYLRGAIVKVALFRSDPRSPRKNASDLYKAAIHPHQPLMALKNLAGEIPKVWDYIDKRRVTVQKQGLSRWRPAFLAGWEAEGELMCILPDYISPEELHDVIIQAGMFAGLGDFRPTFGRFRMLNYEVIHGVF
jgi:hypothetical protein